jgi:hypothetical protein
MSPELAQLRHASRARRCPQFRVQRTYRRHRRIDVNANFTEEKIDAGRIPPRPGETGDQTQLDRVFGDAEDDRDRRGRSFGRKCSRSAGRGDHGHATANEVSHQRWQSIELALQIMVLDRDVLALHDAGFVEAFTERSAKARGGLGRPGTDEADDRPHRLLRPRDKRPCRRAAEQCYELAPSKPIELHPLPLPRAAA